MILNNKTFALFAAHHYDNPNCESVEEFTEDLQRFQYLKRLFTKYLATGEIKERLVLNHIVVLYNLFGIECTRMLFLKMEGQWSVLIPFLKELGYLPPVVYEVGKHPIIDTSQLPVDKAIEAQLKSI